MEGIVDRIVMLGLVLLCVAVWAVAINATVVHPAASVETNSHATLAPKPLPMPEP
ncbi:hypothetical protein [Methylobacterium nigriterrae]|uniref:hypothetical protein n=1 Tax=Methylobacterium nigriterrae TaxID=3127512 RepID=UPI003014169F